MSNLQGITREAEEEKLKRTVLVAKQKVERNRQSVKELEEELHAMQEEFDESDKEMQTLWHDTDARFKFVNQDLRRALQAQKKPYFGRIDFVDLDVEGKEAESYYLGRSVIADDPAHPEVIDWRAPIAGVYYDAGLGEATYSVKGEGHYKIDLKRKRTYEIEGECLKDFYDSDVVANDELLTKYLARNKRAVLGEIIATIQKEQNEVIRKKPQHNLIIQGAAGSGKTTVAMHRISYILYNYEEEFAPEDFYIVGSNKVLLNYITGVLPELNVYGVRQMTMEELFIRLLYEDWDKKLYSVKPVQKGVTPAVKGTLKWFRDLEQFCRNLEWELIPREDVRLEKNHTLLLSATVIEKTLEECESYSRADKITRLTELLLGKLENELCGKYYSYTATEKDRLTRRYGTYFGKREWKGSIFDLYEDFLTAQNAKGYAVPHPDHVFDVYDLAALAYLYKRIKEDRVIREAGHVVIDEAQDFGMMAYGSLKYCLSKCTYTIMGDVSQNISMDYGINDWSELRRLMLPGDYDYFGLLRKSYRNTVEISEYATNILCHGSFPLYPVEPIIRHGSAVEQKGFADDASLTEEVIRVAEDWQKDGMETIALVCADEEGVEKLCRSLEGRLVYRQADNRVAEFTEGVMVLSLEYTKGLEFDAVLIVDADKERYPLEDGYVKRLYVAATRALHELKVFYTGEITEIISAPIPEGKKEKAVLQVGSRKKRFEAPEDTRTKAEIYREEAALQDRERQERELYGPRHVQAVRSETKSAAGSANLALPTYLERMQQKDAVKEKTKSAGSRGAKNQFGDMPDTTKLMPPGHGRIDCSVRFVMKGTGYYDFVSSYGTLRIKPVANDTIRITFQKGQIGEYPEAQKELVGSGKLRFKESPSVAELATEKLTLRVDKKSGAFEIFNTKQKSVLAERQKEPRQADASAMYNFFEWKKEKLIAAGLEDWRVLEIGSAARYISYGREFDKLPRLAISAGAELILPKGAKAYVCNIPTYGSYLCMEETTCLDYYVKVK